MRDRKDIIKDFKEFEKFNGNLMINNFSKGVSNNGQPYLNITFQDSSGTIEGKKWEINDRDLSLVEIGNIVYVNAEVLKYREKNQLKVLTISEKKGEINLSDFIKSAPQTKDEYLNAIQTLKSNNIKVLADIVLNHKMGADETEEVLAVINSNNKEFEIFKKPNNSILIMIHTF